VSTLVLTRTSVDCDLVFGAAGQHHLQTLGVDSTPELTLVLTPGVDTKHGVLGFG
jgi:hypothetical protein